MDSPGGLTARFRRERPGCRWGDVAILECEPQTEGTGKLWFGGLNVKCECDIGELSPGVSYHFRGRWIEHPKYGRQFHADSFMEAKPHGEDGVVRYLLQCPGIGKVTAQKLWDVFGCEAVRVLREDPMRACRAAVALRPAKAQEASAELRELDLTEAATIDLLDLLSGRGFPRNLPRKLIRQFGAGAARLVRKNPYLLWKYKRVGFSRVDKLYLDLGGDPAAVKRQTLCIQHGIKTDGTGSVWFSAEAVTTILRQKIAGTPIQPVPAVLLGRRARILATKRVESLPSPSGPLRTCPLVWVAEHQAAEDERLIVAWLRAAKQGHEWPEVKALDISNHQREQLVGTLQGRIGILTGSPGTGKTYALARVVAACADKHGFESVSVCAPTGKAAVRITQAMSLYGVNVQATTIHSLLGVEKRSDDGDWGFRHNHANPLPCQYVCVDEPSMIDTSLMASLLDACGPATHVLFAGDPNQLPPVGRGKPMLDMIHAGLPCGSLREIHRNSGLIVEACAAIRDGGSIKFCDRLDPDNGRNLKLIRAEGAADVCAAIRNVIAWMRELPGFQPIYDCQFLVALNKSGPLSRLILNRTLRPLLNPRGQEIASNFHMGDKVICLRNGFYRVKEYGCNQQERTNREIYVANGDQGVVWGGDAAGLKVAMSFRREVIWVPISQAGDDGTDDQDGEENGSAKRWTHADTITCHKSQGSEWPLTVTVLDGSYGASRVTSRNWLTTAISRGQRAEILIGSQSTIGSMRGRDAISGRKTFLTELIQGG